MAVGLAVSCPERPPCEGCNGGRGYRGPDGRRVGFGVPEKVCALHARCTFENAAGSGANRDCALAKPAAKPREAVPAGE